MELNITHMINDADEMPMLSGSAAELGDNAGKITWNNSKAYAEKYPLLKTAEELKEAKDYFKSYGAWDNEEIAAWSDLDIQTLIIQEIAANIREMECFDTIEEYAEAVKEGEISGSLYQGDNEQWYAYIGN